MAPAVAQPLFGCGPGGALSGTTTLPLAGGLAASLVLNVDLSGKG